MNMHRAICICKPQTVIWFMGFAVWSFHPPVNQIPCLCIANDNTGNKQGSCLSQRFNLRTAWSQVTSLEQTCTCGSHLHNTWTHLCLFLLAHKYTHTSYTMTCPSNNLLYCNSDYICTFTTVQIYIYLLYISLNKKNSNISVCQKFTRYSQTMHFT